MSECPLRRAVPILAALLLAGSLRAAEITGAAWHGPDLILTLSDSTGYAVDLIESDSSQIVIHFPDVAKRAGLATEAISGPQGRHAALTRESVGLRLTVAGEGRLGYATEWRPYTHRLIVHTFDWSTLPYQEQQFHKGLLALEEHLDDRARELLDVAYATGDRRAGALLGIRYARRGKDSLALRYLRDPADADEYMALADVDRRHGDTAAAQVDETRAQEILNRELPPTTEAPQMYPRPRVDRGMESRPERFERRYDGWRWVAVGAGAAIILLGFAVWWLSRTIGRRAQQAAGTPAGSAAPPPDSGTTAASTPPPVRTPPTASVPAPARPVTAPAAETPVAVTTVAETPAAAAVTPAAEAPVRTAEPAAAVPPVEIAPREAAAVVAPPMPAEAPQKPVTPPVPATPPAPVAPLIAETGMPAREEHAGPPQVPEQKAQLPTMGGDPPHELERALPAQAAEVRQKLQAQRKDMPAPAESTVAAARRLHISRDNVELRRKMAEAARKKDQ